MADDGASRASAQIDGALAADEDARGDGVDWRVELVKAVGRWPIAQDGGQADPQAYRLVGGAAMDWRQVALLACRAGGSQVLLRRARNWLARTDAHGGLSIEEFKHHLGPERYRIHLNYFYGVTVERAALLAERDALAKDLLSNGRVPQPRAILREAYRNLYGTGREELRRRFLEEEGGALGVQSSRARAAAEFTFWLFRQRMDRSEPAKLASDTKRALEWMEGQGG